MRRAKVEHSDELVQRSCANCGEVPHESIQIRTEKGHVAWSGCKLCWPKVLERGQLWVVEMLCRQADDFEDGPKEVGDLPEQPDLRVASSSEQPSTYKILR